ncbi:MAG: YfcC family protein [Acholeplasmataceae bacterium]|nr:MAG: YfcC family protein [Acholeplasmataceae bacterium]
MENQANLLHISKKAFISVVLILLGLMVVAGILTHIIPAGTYVRDADGMVIDGTYQVLPDGGHPVWRWLTAPVEVLWSADAVNVIVIGLFLIILGGTFTLMDKTGGIHVLIKRLIKRFKHNKYMLLRVVILFFMAFGAFFGIFEESIALLPILILLSLSLGWDTMTGLGMCLLAAGFGFATAVTNPFSVGIASNLAGISILSGAWYRIIIFIIMYGVLQFFLVRYAKKVEAHPETSLTYDSDREKVRDFNPDQALPYDNEALIFRAYVILFVVLFGGILGAGLAELVFGSSIPAIPLMAVIFLIGGLTAGYVVSRDIRFTFKTFASGMLSVAPAFILIVLAVSVKHIITEGGIMDTILFNLANALSGQSPYIGILFIYGLVLFIQFFVGSASAKAFLIMPLLIPLVALVGISKELAILAFVFGDGYTNVIFPTNGVLLIGLSIASVSYGKWFRFTFKLQVFTLLLTAVLLMLGILIGY